ncbi:hypothetical protein KY362_01470 [Candidatus Woesearchaeota archaeon]|nr:hypothetical protein [Candidatus Woesearchaeota archaeon]
MEKAIGLDIGTSSAKGILYDKQLNILSIAKNKNKIAKSPTDIFDAAIKTITEISDKDVKTIGLCTIFPTLIALDKQCKPLTDVYIWSDTQGQAMIDRILNENILTEHELADLHLRTGCVLHQSYNIWRIRWLAHKHPHTHAQTWKYLSLPDYIALRMTGKTYTTHTTASTTGLYNHEKRCWDDEAMRIAGITEEKLPTIKPINHAEEITEDICNKTGLCAGTTFVSGSEDGLMCHKGSGCAQGNEKIMSSTIGTSGALRINSTAASRNNKIWSYLYDDDRYILGSAINAGGITVQWLDRLAGTRLNLAELEANMSAVTADSPIFLPFTHGERGPGYHPNRKAHFTGFDTVTDISTTYRAVMEGIMFNLYACYQQITEDVGTPDRIFASGGYIKSDVWLQMQADIFNETILVPDVKEAAARGAAATALQATGINPQIQSPPIIKEYRPDEKMHAIYKERFKKFNEAYITTTPKQHQNH